MRAYDASKATGGESEERLIRSRGDCAVGVGSGVRWLRFDNGDGMKVLADGPALADPARRSTERLNGQPAAIPGQASSPRSRKPLADRDRDAAITDCDRPAETKYTPTARSVRANSES